MVVKTRSQVPSDRQKWDKIFEGLVKMLKTQQQQVQTLVQERKILEDRINMQYKRWVSDVRLYEDHIFQLKGDLDSKDMALVLEAAKSEMMVGLKRREAYLCKLKLEETEDELTDFRIWFDILSNNSKDISQKDLKETNKNGRTGRNDSGSKSEVRRLKLEYENLASEKSSQVDALMAENKFAWNQLSILETQYTDKLNSKLSELEKANQKIEALISHMEELRSSNTEKDEIIERLKSEVSQKEADASRFREEVSIISREVEFLRKSKCSSCTPTIKRCTAGGRTSVKGAKNGGRDGCNDIVKKESSASRAPDLVKENGEGGRSSKRKRDDQIPISETPKLFTSTFKVPRLKTSTPKTR